MLTFNSGALPAPIRIMAVTLTACGCLFLPASARAAGLTGNEIAQPVHKLQPARFHKGQGQAAPSEEAEPRAKPAAEKPAVPEEQPAGEDAKPDDEEEVSPGDNPASCDGCELAGLVLGGSLWGLFGVSRRRGIPRPVIYGLQPR